MISAAVAGRRGPFVGITKSTLEVADCLKGGGEGGGGDGGGGDDGGVTGGGEGGDGGDGGGEGGEGWEGGDGGGKGCWPTTSDASEPSVR